MTFTIHIYVSSVIYYFYLLSQATKSEGVEKLITSFSKPNSSSFIPLPSATEEETAESILDQHCLRIWKSSTHHTPSHSPPHSPPHSKSPDRHKDARRKTLALSTSMSAAYGARGYHKKRDFISYDLDDRNLIVCGTETHRHIHHHHHHHHSSRDSFKKSIAEMEAQTCGISSWRTDPAQNISAEFCGGDYGRGRVGNRKIDTALRECSETSSNIDSGISMMESVKMPPNWNNPTNEKYVVDIFSLYKLSILCVNVSIFSVSLWYKAMLAGVFCYLFIVYYWFISGAFLVFVLTSFLLFTIVSLF